MSGASQQPGQRAGQAAGGPPLNTFAGMQRAGYARPARPSPRWARPVAGQMPSSGLRPAPMPGTEDFLGAWRGEQPVLKGWPDAGAGRPPGGFPVLNNTATQTGNAFDPYDGADGVYTTADGRQVTTMDGQPAGTVGYRSAPLVAGGTRTSQGDAANPFRGYRDALGGGFGGFTPAEANASSPATPEGRPRFTGSTAGLGYGNEWQRRAQDSRRLADGLSFDNRARTDFPTQGGGGWRKAGDALDADKINQIAQYWTPELIKQGKSLQDALPPDLQEYMQQNGLFIGNDHNGVPGQIMRRGPLGGSQVMRADDELYEYNDPETGATGLLPLSAIESQGGFDAQGNTLRDVWRGQQQMAQSSRDDAGGMGGGNLDIGSYMQRMLMGSPTGYDDEALRGEFDRLAGQIDDQFKLDQSSLESEMAARGLADSAGKGLMTGRLSDLNVGRRSAKVDLAERLSTKRAEALNSGRMGWLDRLTQFGQSAFDNDYRTAALNADIQNAQDRLLLSLLGGG